MQDSDAQEPVDVPLTDMSTDDLRQLKGLYEQSRTHYLKILGESNLKEGDILAVKMCLAEVEKEINDINIIIATKN
jgi:hypothetical protein